MSQFDVMRLRGTVIAVSTFFVIVSLYVIIDQRPGVPASASPTLDTSTTTTLPVETTIPVDNRLCGLAQRLMNSLPQDEPAVVRAMQDFYTEAASFTEGDLRGDLIAASRLYTELNVIATKAQWDVARIVRNSDGERWKALLTGTPTGVREAIDDVRELCRLRLPDPPSIETDSAGRIRDPVLAKLLAQPDRELY